MAIDARARRQILNMSHLVVLAILLDEVLVALNPVLADTAERLAALHSLDYVVHVVHQEQRRQRLFKKHAQTP